MNKSKLEDEVFYGGHAETLASNPAYQAAITRIRARLFDSFGSTGFFQRRKRDEIWRMKRVIDDFEQELEIMIRDGKLAQQDLNDENLIQSDKIK